MNCETKMDMDDNSSSDISYDEHSIDDDLDEIDNIMNNMMLEYESVIACVNVKYNNGRADNIDYHFDENDNKMIEEVITNDIFERVTIMTGSMNVQVNYKPFEDVVFDGCLYKKIFITVILK